jgi:3-hydroxybutyryl-CoA dehydrogenase
VSEKVAVIGSGAIACGLAAVAAARLGDAVLVARSDDSCARASRQTGKLMQRLEAQGRIDIGKDLAAIGGCTYVVEAIAEDFDHKAEVLAKADRYAADDAVLATTTSSLSIDDLAAACGRPERFVGFHVFNPVTKMELIELAYPPRAIDEVRERSRDLCAALGKTGVEVPDIAGFVVNRLLFPFLFDAVRLADEHDVDPAAVDQCMTLGAGHPMGPLALLDFVGIDVAIAIGESIGAEIPARLRELAADGHLGKKAGRGFFDYDQDAVALKKS